MSVEISLHTKELISSLTRSALTFFITGLLYLSSLLFELLKPRKQWLALIGETLTINAQIAYLFSLLFLLLFVKNLPVLDRTANWSNYSLIALILLLILESVILFLSLTQFDFVRIDLEWITTVVQFLGFIFVFKLMRIFFPFDLKICIFLFYACLGIVKFFFKFIFALFFDYSSLAFHKLINIQSITYLVLQVSVYLSLFAIAASLFVKNKQLEGLILAFEDESNEYIFTRKML